jgi:carboxylesterase type B
MGSSTNASKEQDRNYCGNQRPPACPQTGASSQTPAAYGFVSALGNEDCLFMNVYAPANAKNLPVFFWIRMFTVFHIIVSTNLS